MADTILCSFLSIKDNCPFCLLRAFGWEDSGLADFEFEGTGVKISFIQDVVDFKTRLDIPLADLGHTG
jgi:hypothetical protein